MKIEIMDVDHLGYCGDSVREIEEGLVYRDEDTGVIYLQDVDSVISVCLKRS